MRLEHITAQLDPVLHSPQELIQRLGESAGAHRIHVWGDPLRVDGGVAVRCACGYVSAIFYVAADCERFVLSGCPQEWLDLERERNLARLKAMA